MIFEWWRELKSNYLGDVQDAFDIFDHNEDGGVDREELEDLLKATGEHFTAREIDESFKNGDQNGDGMIDMAEAMNNSGEN